MRKMFAVVVFLVGCSQDEVCELPDAAPPSGNSGVVLLYPDNSLMRRSDACVHVQPELGPGPFSGCTCGDVLEIDPNNPDLVRCVGGGQ